MLRTVIPKTVRLLHVLAAVVVLPIAVLLLLLSFLVFPGLFVSIFQENDSPIGLSPFLGMLLTAWSGYWLFKRGISWLNDPPCPSLIQKKYNGDGEYHDIQIASPFDPDFPNASLSIQDIDQMTGLEFEHFYAMLICCMGHSAEVTQASNDFGVDIIAVVNNERIAIQAKRYTSNVSRTAVSDAVAGKAHYNCQRAAVVTCAYFTKSAIQFANSVNCKLVDRNAIEQMLRKYGRHPDLLKFRKPVGQPEAPQPIPIHAETQQVVATELPVPNNVKKQVLADAARDFPGDFQTQESVFEDQCRSYAYCQSLEEGFPEVPREIKSEILSAAAKDFPGDYSMQQYIFEEQCKSYQKLQRLDLE